LEGVIGADSTSLSALFAASGAAGHQVTILHYGRGCVGITPEMVFGLRACLLYDWQAPAWCLLLKLTLKLILVPTLCPHPFSRQ
jgi:hypothetical protein